MLSITSKSRISIHFEFTENQSNLLIYIGKNLYNITLLSELIMIFKQTYGGESY